MLKNKSQILAALFDVRPVTEQGNLDIGKVEKIETVLDLRDQRTQKEAQERKKAIEVRKEKSTWPEYQILPFRDLSPPKEKPIEESSIEELPTREEILTELAEIETAEALLEKKQISLIREKEKKEEIAADAVEEIIPLDDFYFPEAASQELIQSDQPVSPIEPKEVIWPAKAIYPKLWPAKSFLGFMAAGLLIALVIPTAAWLSQGLIIKNNVLSSGFSAYQNLLSAQESLEQADWQTAGQDFSLAHLDFLQAEKEIQQLGQLTLGILERLPGGHLVSSGSRLVKVGEYLAQAGQNLTSAANIFSSNNLFSLIKLTDSSPNGLLAAQESSLTDLMAANQFNLNQALENISLANQELRKVKIEALPVEIQEPVSSLTIKLPLVEEMLGRAMNYTEALLSILGHNNPRQYLLIFQNNSESRATGGFIGTYGLLALDRGKLKELFIEGVFNADGQLHEKVIPPRPIQKISTAWSMHDANWFADFPTSAEKITWFYEKTGGPTVDGAISFTPLVIERLMKLTGPIALTEYQATLTPDNFVELIQYKVEVDYDKEINQPKKILADFAPKFIERLGQLSSIEKKEAIEIIFDCFKEKHILIYFKDQALEKLAIEEGWAGQLLTTDRDYLSVVSSNINGYKTDRVVEEIINHQAEIKEDGSIIDTLTISRQHQGGQLEYDWWNRVNANYLRVYLPKGSQLLSASGQTIEIYQPPIDYQKQGFQADSLVETIENKMVIDSKTGTHIFEESNKTVFGNWLYVSPGEKATLTYQYKLPFKIDLDKSSDSYGLLIQKQAGSLGSQFSHRLVFPDNWQVSWQHPSQLKYQSGLIDYQTDLKTDRFLGLTFEF